VTLFAVRLVYLALFLALIGGVYSALLGWRPGAFLAIAGLSGTVVFHLVGGLIEYRRTMNRPWPKVPPLDDEDDD
jgi:hypothetical protein